MSSGMQSQDEVDALMAGAMGEAAPAEAPQGAPGGATGALPTLDQRPGGAEARQAKRGRREVGGFARSLCVFALPLFG